MEKILLSQSDIARRLGVSRQMIHKLYKAGRLPAPDGDGVPPMWEVATIDEWIAQRRQAKNVEHS